MKKRNSALDFLIYIEWVHFEGIGRKWARNSILKPPSFGPRSWGNLHFHDYFIRIHCWTGNMGASEFICRIFLPHFPERDNKHEDLIRVRNWSGPFSNFAVQFPIWLSGLFNWIIMAEEGSINETNDLFFCFGNIVIVLLSMFFTTICGMGVQGVVIKKMRFEYYSSRDLFEGRVPKTYGQLGWPSSIKQTVSKNHTENEKNLYLINQRKAWKSLHLRSYIFGMLFTNTLGWIFMLGSEILISVTLISLFLFMWLTWPQKKLPYGSRGY